MSNIVLDTSILIPDFRLRGKVFQAVLHTAKDLRDDIYIPKIVVDELINKFREELQSYYNSLRNYEDKIENLTGSHIEERRILLSEQITIYSDWLQRELSKKQIHSISYPTISHELLVKRALARRRPFCPEGQRGYRDAVLWETILQWKKFDRHEILFVSRNTRDFADPQDSHKLHPHLIEDLRSLKHDEASIQFFAGFEELLARALSPRQRLFPELEAQVNNGRLGQHELILWLARVLPGTAVRNWTARMRRQEWTSWVIGEIHTINRLSLSSTSRLTERTILVILLFTFSADIVPKQQELLLGEISEIRNAEFICFAAVEFEYETNTVMNVEIDHVICLET
jgi:hypothetical protein